MVLSDRDIRAAIAEGRIVVERLDDNAIQPASVDLRLGAQFRVFAQHQEGFIDVKQEMAHLTRPLPLQGWGSRFLFSPLGASGRAPRSFRSCSAPGRLNIRAGAAQEGASTRTSRSRHPAATT